MKVFLVLLVFCGLLALSKSVFEVESPEFKGLGYYRQCRRGFCEFRGRCRPCRYWPRFFRPTLKQIQDRITEIVKVEMDQKNMKIGGENVAIKEVVKMGEESAEVETKIIVNVENGKEMK